MYMPFDSDSMKGFIWRSYYFVDVVSDGISLRDSIDYAHIEKTRTGFKITYRPALGEPITTEKTSLQATINSFSQDTIPKILICVKQLGWK